MYSLRIIVHVIPAHSGISLKSWGYAMSVFTGMT